MSLMFSTTDLFIFDAAYDYEGHELILLDNPLPNRIFSQLILPIFDAACDYKGHLNIEIDSFFWMTHFEIVKSLQLNLSMFNAAHDYEGH